MKKIMALILAFSINSFAAALAAGSAAEPQAAVKKGSEVRSEGKTIAEIFAQKDKLAGQSVSVRGTVVKFVRGVMNKNWVHLADGTGSEADKTADLTVTTQELVKVGDVILVKGKLTTNKDLGSGYFYPAIIEDAIISR